MVAVEQTMNQQPVNVGDNTELNLIPPEIRVVDNNEQLRQELTALEARLQLKQQPNFILDVSRLMTVSHTDQQIIFSLAKKYPHRLSVVGLSSDLVGLTDVMNVTMRRKNYELPR